MAYSMAFPIMAVATADEAAAAVVLHQLRPAIPGTYEFAVPRRRFGEAVAAA